MSGFFTPSRIMDIFVAVITIIMVLRYMRSGFISGVVDFCGTLLAVGGASWGAKSLAPKMFDVFFFENLVSRTENSLVNSQGILTLNDILNKISGFLPQNIIDTFLRDYTSGADFNLADPDIARTIVVDVIQPMVMPVLSVLIFFMIFIVGRIVISFIATALKGINKIPLVGTLNKSLGAGIGLLVGLLYGFLIVYAVWALVVITGGDLPFLQNSTLQNSLFFGLFDGLIPYIK